MMLNNVVYHDPWFKIPHVRLQDDSEVISLRLVICSIDINELIQQTPVLLLYWSQLWVEVTCGTAAEVAGGEENIYFF